MRALFLISLLLTASPAWAAFPDYFNSPTTISSNIRPFSKWTGMLDRYENERKLFEQQCTGSDGNACRMHKWTSFIESIRSKTPLEQIRAVNKEMNKSQYVLDIVNWGMQDYWATPLEFFIKNGDCEDYAISKYLSLRLLGFTEAQLRIVVLQDLNLGVPHAILIVNLNGKAMALDNFFAQPVASTKIHHYKPIYSINETAWWRHR